ncbi:MAG: trypsin-like peptidase domain-containing protein [Paenirhodobacter sp.]|uniref:trypsin-like peptidase domain-containing protein n=1 Tax=Paenirhodobacter sp. TaxID=1965326 RepID=UPI003D11F1FF
MKRFSRAISITVGAVLTGMVWTGAGWAEPSWVQIEAQPSLAKAQERARDWGTTFPDLAGFAMNSGWYAIAIGPFDDIATATTELRRLRREGLIPADSYVSDGNRFRGQFWPVGAALTAPADPATPAAPEETVAPAEPQTALPSPAAPETIAPETPAPETTVAEPAPEPVETLADSRRLEAALPRETRIEIQSALQWQGFYASALDGAFGRGTRASIAAWQAAQGHEPTGVLSSAQQGELLNAVAAERAALGLTPVTETEAGIAIDLPMGLVEFDHYDPPFVHYRAKDGSGVSVLLISEPGDQNTLFGLYDAMQTLEIVPMQGERHREKTSFTLTGQNDRIHSQTEVRLSAGLIKGFTLVWPAGEDARMSRVLAAMQTSFKPVGDTALDPTLGKPMEVPRADLISGLDVRHPEFARSGFYITEKGAVLTAAAGLDQCGRITVEDEPAELSLIDAGLGIAVLTPKTPVAPAAVAPFEIAQIGPGADITVAGFSYPEALSAPVLSFGTLSDLTGLAGEASHARLAVHTLPGDAGGPVLDGGGAVIGVVLPRAADAAKLLPEDLTEAVQATAIAPVLAEKGFAPAAAEGTGTLAAEDISALAQKFTVQIACWK